MFAHCLMASIIRSKSAMARRSRAGASFSPSQCSAPRVAVTRAVTRRFVTVVHLYHNLLI